MNSLFYQISSTLIRFVRMQCLNEHTLHLDRLDRTGAFLIACTHVSHTEPALLGSMLSRPVRWVARREYYRHPVARTVLDWAGTIMIERAGPPPVRAVRRCVEHLRNGELVGIFPEGGVMRRNDCIFRGGVNRAGAIVIAQRAGVPIVPVVMLGTEKLNAIDPWLPGKTAHLWVGVGEALPPVPTTRKTQRSVRLGQVDALRQRFVDVYQELLTEFDLDDSKLP